LKFQIECGGGTYTLDVRCNGGGSRCEYSLSAAENCAGVASVAEIQAGQQYSVLDQDRSFTVYLAPRGGELEVWVNDTRYLLALSDARDRSGKSRRASASGPLQVSSQMPGKVVKILVVLGAAVKAGQGLVVVEAMKMQNELKAPREGTVARIDAVEGATVVANQALVVIE
jgi:acetyl/propionyl-CoA carboxylase alpha subunit